MPHEKISLRKELAMGMKPDYLSEDRKAKFAEGGAVGQHKAIAMGKRSQHYCKGGDVTYKKR